MIYTCTLFARLSTLQMTLWCFTSWQFLVLKYKITCARCNNVLWGQLYRRGASCAGSATSITSIDERPGEGASSPGVGASSSHKVSTSVHQVRSAQQTHQDSSRRPLAGVARRPTERGPQSSCPAKGAAQARHVGPPGEAPAGRDRGGHSQARRVGPPREAPSLVSLPRESSQARRVGPPGETHAGRDRGGLSQARHVGPPREAPNLAPFPGSRAGEARRPARRGSRRQRQRRVKFPPPGDSRKVRHVGPPSEGPRDPAK